MDIHVTYPIVKKKGFFRRNAHDLWRGLFTIAAYTCLIVDMLTPGIHWSLIVIGGLGVIWIAVITAWSGVDYFVRNFDCIRNAK